MDQLQFLDRIKRLVIIAMFSDDDLMERLVLKGGNLLDVIFGIASRASLDLDFSIEGEFESATLLSGKIQKVLAATFADEGFEVFDVNLSEVPPGLSAAMKDFWGGYKIDFKIIEKKRFDEFKHDAQKLRMHAPVLGKAGSPKFKIDISKHEYCGEKVRTDLDGFTIYTYSPAMVVGEKLRAVCQQMPEYVQMVRSHASARARDFLDIYTLVEHFGIDFEAEAFRAIIQKVFDVKRAPLRLIGQIGEYREYHRPDFVAVQSTVKAGFELRDYYFYTARGQEWGISSHPDLLLRLRFRLV